MDLVQMIYERARRGTVSVCTSATGQGKSETQRILSQPPLGEGKSEGRNDVLSSAKSAAERT